MPSGMPCPRIPPVPDAAAPADRTVLDAADIARALTRIAHEILERNKGGARPRPARHPHPRRPAGRTHRRADRRRRGRRASRRRARHHDVPRRPAAAAAPAPLGHTAIPAGGIDDKVVVLVDDVLFSGRTIRAALDALERPRPAARRPARRPGRPRPPRAADPGRLRRQEPADLAGSEKVQVRLAEIDGDDAVLIGIASDAGGGDPMKRHLLSAADLTRDDAAAGPGHRRRDGRARRPADQEAARRCAAAPSSTCSSRTRPAPGSRSRWPPSGCPPT